MASRKEQKEQARAERLAAEQANQAKAAQMRRFQIFGGVIVAVVVVVVAAIAISSGGSSGSSSTVAKSVGHGTTLTAAEKQIDNTVSAELAGIPQHGVELGNPKAKVTMLYFGDLQCPICAAFTTGSTVEGSSAVGGLPQFIADQVKTGHVKVIYRSMCTATCNDYSNGQSIFTNQQSAAYAAGKQNLFWNFAETFYREQGTEGSGYVTPTFIRGIAEQIPGLNKVQWQADRSDSALTSQVTSDEQLASKDGLQGTPALIMIGPKREELVNNGDFSDYPQMLAAYKAVA